MATSAAAAPGALPRVVIRFCTQCRWLLRAAYYGQELLSTFALTLGEVALQPAAGGVFVISLVCTSLSSTTDDAAATATTPPPNPSTTTHLVWDRARDGGFPETKELKRRVRDLINPSRSLGHFDRPMLSTAGRDGGHHGPPAQDPTLVSSSSMREHCEDCVSQHEGD